MKKTLRALILTLGILATTGMSSAVYAQDCNTIKYTVKATSTKATKAPAKAPTPTKTTPSKTTTAPNLTENNKLEKEVVVLVNKERAKQGLAPLKDNSQLSNVARTKSEDMVAKKDRKSVV